LIDHVNNRNWQLYYLSTLIYVAPPDITVSV